jgi:hypothetical protein
MEAPCNYGGKGDLVESGVEVLSNAAQKFSIIQTFSVLTELPFPGFLRPCLGCKLRRRRFHWKRK